MSGPTQIEPSAFFDFIGRRGLVVVFIPLHIAHPFNPALVRHFRREADCDVEFGRVSLLQLVLRQMPAALFLAQGLRACGIFRPFDVLPGYYLFRDGQMIAWDSGFASRADLRHMVGPSLLGAVGYAFTRNRGVLTTTLRIGAREAAASRLAAAFADAAKRPPPSAAPPRPPPRPPMSDLMAAYRLLGVEPTATDREVMTAWRKLQTELHPDLAADDPQEYLRRTELMTELNRAREIIRAHRGRARASGQPSASPFA